MKRVVAAGATSALMFGGGLVGWGQVTGDAAMAQSSSPFSKISGWFGGEEDSPLELNFDIAGDDGALERRIRAASLVQGARTEGRITAQDILAAARGDYARILGTLYDSGYYDAIINITLDGVEAAQIAPLDAPDAVQSVTIAIQTGPQFRFSRADIAPVAPGSELPSDYRQGEPAGTGVIKSAAIAGVDGWRNAGHAKADVASTDIVADHNVDMVDSRVVLAPGPALTFGQLTIRGYDRMDPRRLRKMAGFPEGQRFDPEKIDDMRKRLRRSGVFSAITITETDGVGLGDTQDVDLLVIEQKTRRIGGGFELSNENGLALTGYWMHRNLLGGGERLRFDAAVSDIGAETSGRDYSAGVRLDRPATLHPDVTGYLQFQVARTRDEDYDLDSATFGLGFTYLPSDWLTADIALQYNAQRVNDEGEKSDFRFFALPMSVTWDRRDDQTDPTAGYWLNGNLTPFLGMDDTDSGARFLGEGRAYFSPGTEKRLTFAGRARLGTIFGAELAQTPRDYLFYSGGGGSVRGQPYESLGVEVIQGPGGPIKTGGMSVANMSAEVRFQLREKIGLAAFADWGQVWTEDSFGGDSGSHSGAGIGVRYKTPIGPLRFDVAGPVSGDTGSGVQVYLGLGQAF